MNNVNKKQIKAFILLAFVLLFLVVNVLSEMIYNTGPNPVPVNNPTSKSLDTSQLTDSPETIINNFKTMNTNDFFDKYYKALNWIIDNKQKNLVLDQVWQSGENYRTKNAEKINEFVKSVVKYPNGLLNENSKLEEVKGFENKDIVHISNTIIGVKKDGKLVSTLDLAKIPNWAKKISYDEKTGKISISSAKNSNGDQNNLVFSVGTIDEKGNF